MPSPQRCPHCGGIIHPSRGQTAEEAVQRHIWLTHIDVEPEQQQARLPFFVYGTLRPGFGLSRIWLGTASAVYDGDALLPGYRLVTWNHFGFPYAIPAEGHAAVGCLVIPHSGAAYRTIAAQLDQVEGYPHHYDRVRVVVETPEGPVEAWVYTPPDPHRYVKAIAVDGDDWATTRAQVTA